MSSLDFYINSKVSKQKQNSLRRRAEVEFGINLNIIDARKLADDSDEYTSIKTTVFDIYKVPQVSDPLHLDRSTKAIFDMLAMGRETGKLKNQFIVSFILIFLLDNPNSTTEQVFKGVSSKLSDKYDLSFYRNRLNDLKGKKIIYTPVDKQHYALSIETESKVRDIVAIADSQEALLMEQIKQFMDINKIDGSPNELVTLIYNIYKDNYAIDVDEISSTSSSFGTPLRQAYMRILDFLESKGFKEPESRIDAARELIDICNTNEFLIKMGASLMFTNLFKSDMLEKYINQKTQKVILDTQILLRIICIKYAEIETDDIVYISVKRLLQYANRNISRVKLSTTDDYVEEVAGQIQEAVKLERFLNLPYINKLGPSRNVFYNYYLTLKSANLISGKSFIEFMNDIVGMKISEIPSHRLTADVAYKIGNILKFSNIDIISHRQYDDFYLFKKEYDNTLVFLQRDKAPSTKEHDLRTALYLSTYEFHVDSKTNIFNEPYFVTYDSSFYEFRKNLFKKSYRNRLSYWYLYSPMKLVDRLSVMNFKIDSKSMNFNIIALAETNFNFSSKEVQFFDLISSLFNKNDISELDLAKKLADLHERTVFQEEKEDFADISVKTPPLTEILLSLRNYYHSDATIYKFNDFVALLQTTSYTDRIINTITKYMDEFMRVGSIDRNLFIDFNHLIEKAINEARVEKL